MGCIISRKSYVENFTSLIEARTFERRKKIEGYNTCLIEVLSDRNTIHYRVYVNMKK